MALTKYMATSQDTYPEHSHQWILIAYTGERPSVRYRNFGPFPGRQDAIEFMREYKKKYTSPVPISKWLIDPLCNPVGGNPNRLTSSGTVLECRSDTSGEPSMTNDFRSLCAELLRGLDENRHPEVRYPGHLRQIMASARAALAETDEPAVPAPPADGEVAELVAWLYSTRAARLTRAAELLQRQAPVAVSERLPGSEDCDEQGRCWAGTRAFVDTRGDRDIDYPPSWELREVCAQDDVWLPFHALPLPEVNNG